MMRNAIRNRIVLVVIIAFSLLYASIAWITNYVIPSNVTIATEAIRSVESEFRKTGQFSDEVASIEKTNCWGQKIEVMIVTGWPDNKIEVSVTSRGPFGVLGNASRGKLIEPYENQAKILEPSGL